MPTLRKRWISFAIIFSNHNLMADRPIVGIGVAIRKDGKVLLGKRCGSHGKGVWSFTGGHLEFGESWEDCARRETSEEAGIEIGNIRFGFLTNDVFKDEGRHSVTIFMLADHVSGLPEVMEPDKFEKWEWFAWDELPEPLFLPIRNAIRSGFDPF